MVIQRGGATMQRIVSEDTKFSDFHELVSFENHGRVTHPDEAKASVWIPHSDTTYTMLTIPNAKEI